MDLVVDNLSPQSSSFVEEYNYIHHLALPVFYIWFTIIFASNLLYWLFCKLPLSSGPEYAEMIKHTIEEAIYCSIIICALFVTTNLLNDELVKNIREQIGIIFIASIYFLANYRLTSSFCKAIKNRIFKG